MVIQAYRHYGHSRAAFFKVPICLHVLWSRPAWVDLLYNPAVTWQSSAGVTPQPWCLPTWEEERAREKSTWSGNATVTCCAQMWGYALEARSVLPTTLSTGEQMWTRAVWLQSPSTEWLPLDHSCPQRSSHWSIFSGLAWIYAESFRLSFHPLVMKVDSRTSSVTCVALWAR